MRRLLTYSLLLFTVLSFAQAKKKTDKDLAKGNSQFMDNDYIDAEASYRISQSKNPTQATAAYNMGNAIYRQKSNTEAAYAYGLAIKNAVTKQQKHMAYHNFGNILMKEKDYTNAVEAYKNALRNNPTDEESRYNLALAKEMLEKNPPPPPPKDNKDKNKDKNDKNKDNKSQQPNNGGNKDDKNQPPKDKGDNKDKGDGKNDNKDKGKDGDQKNDGGDKGDNKDQGDQKGGQPKPEAGQNPSKQRMENLLDAMNNEEKKVQDKIKGQKVKVRTTKQEKDW
ncbi:tetratricopeptide repeat protein [Flavobacterium sp. DG1-102-2]|uniref:tetratricopeptide repeat protein n=1 Tax=Flavobacterium sp. DG1-102-2 TaxID=3081663 RepID=UPI002949AB7C|nr:tetratricopeptide repeat protein [Flavobacterium sp. DG1-102-2]MDV6167824.1 tetratricopeptide repeat protein [Flavobacterium sp. DG1-102-2]